MIIYYPRVTFIDLSLYSTNYQDIRGRHMHAHENFVFFQYAGAYHGMTFLLAVGTNQKKIHKYRRVPFFKGYRFIGITLYNTRELTHDGVSVNFR